MNINDLKPASFFARTRGVKALAYGQAGSGKTPLINTCPNPVLLSVEPGLLSMRNSNVPTFEAETGARIAEFFQWIKTVEANNFDTISVDSMSQIMEILVKEDQDKNPKKHGLQVYGEAAQIVYGYAHDLYYMKNKHVYMICKLKTDEDSGMMKYKPYFAGKELNVRIPHLYDLIMFLDLAQIPGQGEHLAFRTRRTHNILARDRSGMLADLEQPNLANIFNKCMT